MLHIHSATLPTNERLQGASMWIWIYANVCVWVRELNGVYHCVWFLHAPLYSLSLSLFYSLGALCHSSNGSIALLPLRMEREEWRRDIALHFGQLSLANKKKKKKYGIIMLGRNCFTQIHTHNTLTHTHAHIKHIYICMKVRAVLEWAVSLSLFLSLSFSLFSLCGKITKILKILSKKFLKFLNFTI